MEKKNKKKKTILSNKNMFIFFIILILITLLFNKPSYEVIIQSLIFIIICFICIKIFIPFLDIKESIAGTIVIVLCVSIINHKLGFIENIKYLLLGEWRDGWKQDLETAEVAGRTLRVVPTNMGDLGDKCAITMLANADPELITDSEHKTYEEENSGVSVDPIHYAAGDLLATGLQEGANFLTKVVEAGPNTLVNIDGLDLELGNTLDQWGGNK